VGEDVVNQIGVLLEQLGSRFELVLEAVSGFGGKLEAVRGEIVGQFVEVGRQMRFISDRIAENREADAVTRADLGAEMVRLGEMLGATRVEFREQLGSLREQLVQSTESSAAKFREHMAEELSRSAATAHEQLRVELTTASAALRKELSTASKELERELPAIADEVREHISASSEAMVKQIDSELKQTSKALASLSRKFERFDDRIAVQTKDQEQRIRKLERRTAAR
jgi:hypothetical protein